jgi:hypothetical protein
VACNFQGLTWKGRGQLTNQCLPSHQVKWCPGKGAGIWALG